MLGETKSFIDPWLKEMLSKPTQESEQTQKMLKGLLSIIHEQHEMIKGMGESIFHVDKKVIGGFEVQDAYNADFRRAIKATRTLNLGLSLVAIILSISVVALWILR